MAQFYCGDAESSVLDSDSWKGCGQPAVFVSTELFMGVHTTYYACPPCLKDRLRSFPDPEPVSFDAIVDGIPAEQWLDRL